MPSFTSGRARDLGFSAPPANSRTLAICSAAKSPLFSIVCTKASTLSTIDSVAMSLPRYSKLSGREPTADESKRIFRANRCRAARTAPGLPQTSILALEFPLGNRFRKKWHFGAHSGCGSRPGADFAFRADMWRVVRETFAEFGRDECPRMAAALAFYAVFALPALLAFTVLVAASVVDREAVTGRLESHLREAMGPVGARQLLALLAQAQQPGHGLVAGLIGAAVLVVSATGALGELQTALNRAWRVEPDPKRGGWWSFLWKRLVSLALLLGIAGLLLASLVASWALAEFSEWTKPHLPDWMSAQAPWALNTLHSLTLVTVLIAVIFKYMPDVRLAWSDVLLGAAVTAVLFVLG